MNTNLFLIASTKIPVMSSNQPDFVFAILIVIGLTILFVLGSMAYILFKIEYSKYNHRKYMQLKEKVLTDEVVKNMYSKIRDKHNGRQLEFPFVKAIDDAYVAARYNLNEDIE